LQTHKNPLNPNALRGTISTSFRAIGAREELEEFARRLYDLSLEPEVHWRSRPSSTKLGERKPTPQHHLDATPSCKSPSIRILIAAGLF
jgi:hypothetical protein